MPSKAQGPRGKCEVCGGRLNNPSVRKGRTCHLRCLGGLSFFPSGECRKCGETVLAVSRGGHAVQCSGRGVNPPNWREFPNAAEIQAKACAGMSKARRGVPRPDTAIRMRAKNPMHDKEVRERVAVILRQKFKSGELLPYGRVGGLGKGKGTPGTPSEQRAWKILKPLGYSREVYVAIPTALKKKYFGAKNYTCDFLHKELKVVIEIDGSSHLRPARVAKDKRKDSFLSSLGYTVHRLPVTFTRSDLLQVARATSGNST